MTLACEDANSKLLEVVTVADVDNDDHVGNSLLQIWLVDILKLGWVKILNFKFSGDADVWLRFLVDAESRF